MTRIPEAIRLIEKGAARGTIMFLTAALLLFLSGPGLLFSSSRPEVTAVVDREEAYIGDRISLEVSVPFDRDTEFQFPDTPEDVGNLLFTASEPLRTGFLGARREGQIYTLTTYDTGIHVIPPVEIKYRTRGQEEWESVLSRQIPIEVKSLLEPAPEDIRDIKSLFGRFRRSAVIIAVLLILLLVIGGLLFWARRKKAEAREAALRARPAHEVAYEKLSALKAMRLPEKGMIEEYYVRLSEIVRYYLEGRFSFRAPEMTTEEFLESLKESPELKEDHKQLLRDFLSHCDMVKFARYGPTPLEMLDSFTAAERLVEQTRPSGDEGGED